MARIRSLHPGQWTAGDFLECTPLARLLALALRNIADDHGAFRWKPTTIKAECLPADNCDIDALMAELIKNEQIIKYEIDGKEYGLIRDFTQWQRPKKPKYTHPIPNEYRTGTEPVENKSDTSTEIAPQRKEVGGNRDEIEDEADLGISEIEKLPSAEQLMADALLKIVGFNDALDIPPEWYGVPFRAATWIASGWPQGMIEAKAKEIMRGRASPPPISYFEKAFANAFASLKAPVPQGKATERSHAAPGKNAVIAAADNLVAFVNAFDQPAPDLPIPDFLDRTSEVRSGEGAVAVRAVSQR